MTPFFRTIVDIILILVIWLWLLISCQSRIRYFVYGVAEAITFISPQS